MENINTFRATIFAIVISMALSSYVDIISTSEHFIKTTFLLFLYLMYHIALFFFILKDNPLSSSGILTSEMMLYFIISYSPIIFELARIGRIENKFVYLFFAFNLLVLFVWLTSTYNKNNKTQFEQNKLLNWSKKISIWLSFIVFIIFFALHLGWSIPDFTQILEKSNST